jgi:hypothetical protein
MPLKSLDTHAHSAKTKNKKSKLAEQSPMFSAAGFPAAERAAPQHFAVYVTLLYFAATLNTAPGSATGLS